MIRRSPRAPVCFLTACAATALSAKDVKLPAGESGAVSTSAEVQSENFCRARERRGLQQVNAACSKQVGVLLDERELWFFQDPNQVALRECFQRGRDRNTPDESGSGKASLSGQSTARGIS